MTNVVDNVTVLDDGYRDKVKTAAFFDCSVSFIEKRAAEGMPSHLVAGRVKFKPREECDPWLEEHGFIQRKGGQAA